MDLHGKIITIEGPNAAGKATQTKLLVEALKGKGYKVEFFAYPEYETPTGQLIRRYLEGEFGDKEALFEFAAFLYAADRAKNQPFYRPILERGGVIVHDRYQESNWAIQTALFHDPEVQEEKLQWLIGLEKYLLPSDHVYYLDVPAQVSLKLMQERGDQDKHELDTAFLFATEVRYQELSERFGWHRVACTDRAGDLLPREEIHQNLMELL